MRGNYWSPNLPAFFFWPHGRWPIGIRWRGRDWFWA